MGNGLSTSFWGVNNYGDSLATTQLESNLMSYLNWAFLCVGAFQNILVNSSGAYGGNESVLRQVSDPNILENTAYEGFRKNWAWESNLDYAYQPIAISGVYVDGNFIPKSSSGQYAHSIDYPAGRVVFNTPITGSPTVQCEYSFRHVNVDISESAWFKQIQFNSYRIDDPNFLLTASGAWNILSENRIQLPAVVIEPIFNVSRVPYGIGDRTFEHSQGVMFNIFAETDYDRKQIHDILVSQEEVVIKGFNKDLLLAASGYPLNYDGTLVSNPKMYPTIANDPSLFWSNIRFTRMTSSEVVSQPPLWQAKVRGSFEMYLP